MFKSVLSCGCHRKISISRLSGTVGWLWNYWPGGGFSDIINLCDPGTGPTINMARSPLDTHEGMGWAITALDLFSKTLCSVAAAVRGLPSICSTASGMMYPYFWFILVSSCIVTWSPLDTYEGMRCVERCVELNIYWLLNRP